MMTVSIRGQMTWKPDGVTGRILYLRLKNHEQWRCYKDFPQYFIPDSAGNSQGYNTFVSLLRQKWEVL